LGRIGPGAMKAVPALIEGTKGSNKSGRKDCALALGSISSRSGGTAVPGLAGLLADPGQEVRTNAAPPPRMVGAKANGTVPVLTKALTDDIPLVRSRAAYTLGVLGPEAKDAAPALAKATKDNDKSVREYSARALSGIKAEPDLAVPVLAALLQ